MLWPTDGCVYHWSFTPVVCLTLNITLWEPRCSCGCHRNVIKLGLQLGHLLLSVYTSPFNFSDFSTWHTEVIIIIPVFHLNCKMVCYIFSRAFFQCILNKAAKLELSSMIKNVCEEGFELQLFVFCWKLPKSYAQHISVYFIAVFESLFFKVDVIIT